MIKGILFDVDGVLIDSEKFMYESYFTYYREKYGLELTMKDLLPFVGMGEYPIISTLAERFGVKEDWHTVEAGVYDTYGELIKGRLRPMPGVTDFIENAKKAGLRLAVATSADRRKLDYSLKEIKLPAELFDFIVSSDMVEAAKPDGSIYRYAAAGIVLKNRESLVFEDALSGHIAAKDAGSPSVGVTSSFPPESQIFAGADLVIKDLSEFPAFSTVEEFNGIYETLRGTFVKNTVTGKVIEMAKEALKNAYAPYSGFRVGAAVLTENGNIYGGCNVENASFGATICAERGAAMTAISTEGKTRFRILAVASESEDPAPPCAICRQFFTEFADSNMQVWLVSTSSGTVKHFRFGNLMPEVFSQLGTHEG